ncbi:MAG: hypothetical protein F9K19_22780, partial [Rhizobiaceae bacterium]
AVLAVAPGAPAATVPSIAATGIPLPMIGWSAADDLAGLPADVVALAGNGDAQRAVRRALAKRQGPIVPLVTEAIYPAAYAHERAVCVDTTAAGGNASLLAAA